jgi:hypothetical protein
MPWPEQPSYEELAARNAELLAVVAEQSALIESLRAEVAALRRQAGRDCLLTEQRPVFPQFSGRVATSVDTVPGHDQRESS